MDFLRSVLIQTVLEPFSKKGHSVWSNACSWSTSLQRTNIYYSDKQRAAVDGQSLTVSEAV